MILAVFQVSLDKSDLLSKVSIVVSQLLDLIHDFFNTIANLFCNRVHLSFTFQFSSLLFHFVFYLSNSSQLIEFDSSCLCGSLFFIETFLLIYQVLMLFQFRLIFDLLNMLFSLHKYGLFVFSLCLFREPKLIDFS